VTTATPSSGRGRWMSAINWFAHAQPALMIAAGVAVVVAYAAPFGLVSVATTVLVTAAVGAFFAGKRHEWHLCSRCAERIPLDPAAEVVKQGKALRWFHRPRWTVLLSGLVAVALLALLVALGPYSLIVVALQVVMYLDWCTDAWAGLWHRPLYPWCPHCDHWGKGRGPHPEPSPRPTPTMETTK
jgi:hypothetical protein